MDEKVTGLILAGGESRRFGGDKARTLIGGRPMIAHVTSAVAAVCSPVLVGLGCRTERFTLSNVRYVRDRFAGAGPLAGIHSGLLASATRWLLVTACDMPFLTSGVLQTLIAAGIPSAQAVIAIDSQGRLHPLCGCYRHDVLGRLETELVSGRRAVHSFLEKLDRVQTVMLPDGPLRNLNFRNDLTAVPRMSLSRRDPALRSGRSHIRVG